MDNKFTCNRCVMDKTAKEIVFTKTGCNFCDTAVLNEKIRQKEKHHFPTLLRRLKQTKKGKKYDVLLGVSGGVDSAYTLHLLLQHNIKPLCYTIDNGWNRKEADESVRNLIKKTGVDLVEDSIKTEAYTSLQTAFIKSGTKNIEIPTDHLLYALLLKTANKYGIKYIISGGNHSTESIMPESWGYNARDLTHIKDVYKKTMGKKLKGVPTCGLLKWNYYHWIKGIRTVNFLDYFEYNRAEAIRLLEKEYDYKETGEKHCENIYTWWVMYYYLFEKFGIDKRKAHLSSLVISGQITRDEALKELQKCPEYPKIGLENVIMKYPKRSSDYFKKDEKLYKFICNVIRKIR